MFAELERKDLTGKASNEEILDLAFSIRRVFNLPCPEYEVVNIEEADMFEDYDEMNDFKIDAEDAVEGIEEEYLMEGEAYEIPDEESASVDETLKADPDDSEFIDDGTVYYSEVTELPESENIIQREFHDGSDINSDQSERKFSCETCGKLFKNSRHLAVHLNTHLPSEKKFVHACSICNKKYSSVHSLRHHIKIVHINVSWQTQHSCR